MESFQRKRPTWLPGLLLVAAVLIAYGPAWRAGFIWDDDAYVTQNPLLTAPDGLRRIWFSLQSPSQYFPLTFTTFYFERTLWGLNPAGYHLVNLLIHAVNAILVWRVLTRLSVPGAWLAAAIFALHPVQVESVAWVTERKNVLMGFFFLCAILQWLSFIDRNSSRPWFHYSLALVCYGLSLSAKTTACTLPVALLLILWLKKMPISGKRLGQIAPFLAMGVAMGLVTVWWERFHQGTQGKLFQMDWLDRLLLANRALWFYFGKLLWPSHLAFSYPRWTISVSDIWWALLTVAVVILVWLCRGRLGRGPEVAMLYYATALAPMLGFFMLYTFLYTFVADHYQYMACIGPFALAAAGLEFSLKKVKAARLLAVAVLLATLGLLTWRQSENYKNLETLWQATARTNPASWLAQNQLGSVYLEEGDLGNALLHIEKALAINPALAGAHYNRGLILAQNGQKDEAMAEYRKAIALEPQMARAHVNLGIALLDNSDFDGAVAEFQQAVQLQPRVATWRENLEIALARKAAAEKLKNH